MPEDSNIDQESTEPSALRRRMLLKAAVGTGVAVAAHSAPKISVVPAYGFTTTTGLSDGECYGVTWSSNNPTGKGWLEVGDHEVDDPVRGPDGGPSDNAGVGPAFYTYDIGPLGNVPAFTLNLTASGCVNNGGGSFSVSGMPAGYCVRFYYGGQAIDDEADSCGGQSGDVAGPGNVVSPSVLANGQTGTISSQGEIGCTGSGQGKITWVFDVAPC